MKNFKEKLNLINNQTKGRTMIVSKEQVMEYMKSMTPSQHRIQQRILINEWDHEMYTAGYEEGKRQAIADVLGLLNVKDTV